MKYILRFSSFQLTQLPAKFFHELTKRGFVCSLDDTYPDFKQITFSKSDGSTDLIASFVIKVGDEQIIIAPENAYFHEVFATLPILKKIATDAIVRSTKRIPAHWLRPPTVRAKKESAFTVE